jgi:hypothetical protein
MVFQFDVAQCGYSATESGRFDVTPLATPCPSSRAIECVRNPLLYVAPGITDAAESIQLEAIVRPVFLDAKLEEWDEKLTLTIAKSSKKPSLWPAKRQRAQRMALVVERIKVTMRASLAVRNVASIMMNCCRELEDRKRRIQLRAGRLFIRTCQRSRVENREQPESRI